ncbi:unnamed protein product, partial [Medioppia subpectinata]
MKTPNHIDGDAIKNNNTIQFEPNIKLLSTTGLYNDGKQEQTIELDKQELHPDELQIISYTSGTTGPPKGIEMTGAQLVRAGVSTSAAME